MEKGLTEIKEQIDNSYLTINKAINGYSAQIAYFLQQFGKRASATWVYQQGERQTLRRANFHENYKRWICSFLLAGNERGADILIADLEKFVRDVKQIIRGRDYLVGGGVATELMTIRRMVDYLLAA